MVANGFRSRPIENAFSDFRKDYILLLFFYVCECFPEFMFVYHMQVVPVDVKRGDGFPGLEL